MSRPQSPLSSQKKFQNNSPRRLYQSLTGRLASALYGFVSSMDYDIAIFNFK
jgi:hypothetical protein